MRQWKIVAGLLAFWLCILLYMTISVPSGSESASRTERNFAKALDELEKLNQQNKEMQQLIAQLKESQALKSPDFNSEVKDLQTRLEKANSDIAQLANKPSIGLTLEEEHARRKAENTVQELWYFLNSQLNKLEKHSLEGGSRLYSLKADLEGYRRTMLDDFEKIRRANNADQWRLNQSKELGDLVQRRFHYLQNPVNCKAAKKLVCNLHKGCGFGCQLHHITYCLIAAYAMERTLILDSKGWRYSSKGWESVFQPLSTTCMDVGGGTRTHWGSSRTEMDKYQVIELPIVDSLHPRPEFMPLAVPEDIGKELEVFHGDPAVWWIGQVIQYLFRMRPEVEKDIIGAGQKMGFKNTVVGVHVRRTDKINLEAAYHSIEEYMEHVEEYYQQLERTRPNIDRQVYLASDDPSVLADAKQKYPNYKFISDNSISQSAGLGTRYSDSSLRGIIIDIYYLARCDFLVCTFSSQVCRVAYEIMQTLHGDASKYFRSLDDVFYYGGQSAHDLRAVEAHPGNDDGVMELKPGDAIGIAGNHWNGFSKGVNRRTDQSALFPSYKAEDTVVKVKMPTYPQVPRKVS
ncbi:alpha-(1,6)-fucosyltransferase-like isoform X2 [Physella acuta]|nr:alpha-(1,6)-fucosyltransferase-like isoform X2 [Physella acuta]XP_059164716.1 alpha-(1,6)-fucosyltransferase-like isoform X2 [Physella acuta]XP_059164717.1 alpha-(1,6)-fucosyltransferase-like isoform X2 [Physella acuta]